MEKETVKILFVCHGNICRSTMAESMMTELVRRNGIEDTFEIASAGTSKDELGSPVYPATVRTLHARKIPVIPHQAVQMTAEDYDNYDLLLGMDTANVQNIKRIVGGDPLGKIHRFLDCCEEPRDIPDPWYTGKFNDTFLDIGEGCDELLYSLLKQRSPEEAITVTETLSEEEESKEEGSE
ncbi:MAG: low molecular weight protein-tyrosine-phosphatase [Eubacteriales bacterium]